MAEAAPSIERNGKKKRGCKVERKEKGKGLLGPTTVLETTTATKRRATGENGASRNGKHKGKTRMG